MQLHNLFTLSVVSQKLEKTVSTNFICITMTLPIPTKILSVAQDSDLPFLCNASFLKTASITVLQFLKAILHQSPKLVQPAATAHAASLKTIATVRMIVQEQSRELVSRIMNRYR